MLNTAKKWSYAESKREYNNKFRKIEELKTEEYHEKIACENCGSVNEMEYHHVIPLIFEGTNEITNIKRFCRSCHQKLHGILTVEHINHADPFEGIQLSVLYPEFLKSKCDNCNNSKGLKLRMVVPFKAGGQHVKGNFTTLCSSCNATLNDKVDENGILDHAELIKAGQKQARLEGKHIGRPFVDKKINNVIVAVYLHDLTVKEAALKYNRPVSTLYKYKRKFDNKFIFEKININSFNILDHEGVLIKHFNLVELRQKEGA